MKRPDLLLYRDADRAAVDDLVRAAGGASELPFVPESELADLIRLSVLAVECENSLRVAESMPAFGQSLRPMRRLGGRPDLPKGAAFPTVILKEEDREPLLRWQEENATPIHIWHAFFDRAYGLSLARAQELLDSGLIEPKEQVFQAPGGSTTQKTTYFFYYQYAYELAFSTSAPELVAESITDKNGHILPYVRFRGGAVSLSEEALGQLEAASSRG